MARFQAMLVPVALLVMASSARAQRWGSSPPAAARAHASPAEAFTSSHNSQRRSLERDRVEMGWISGSIARDRPGPRLVPR